MRALIYEKSIPRYLAVRALKGVWPAVCTSRWSSLRLAEVAPPALPTPEWVRVKPRMSGVCGSDLATITCHGSPYFSAVTSFPFVFGHEIVGEVIETGAAADGVAVGDRVLIEPALGCVVRGLAPPCVACTAGDHGNCINIAGGRLAPGLQTGFCRDTGGGWADGLVAHRSQIHRVPAGVSDDDAVLVEPLTCSVHAVCRAELQGDERVLILGAGSVGLLTLYALKRLHPECTVWVAAKHRHQGELASALGADAVLPTGRPLRDAVIERTGARRHEPDLGKSMVLGGVDVTFDCIGASATIDESIRLTRSRGTVVLVGMPSILRGIEGTALWFQETKLLGAYAYGHENRGDRRVRTFDLALEIAAQDPGRLATLITGRFPLEDYRAAIQNAMSTGSGTIKTVFELRDG